MGDYDDDYEGDRTPRYVGGSGTSENAARSLNPKQRRKQAFRILDLFRGSGATYTTDEIEVELGLLHQSVSARVTELGQAGCIVMTGETRNTGRGDKPAAVWKLVPGATDDMFNAWLKRQKESLQTYKAWTRSFVAAGLAYRKSPTEANANALLDVASTAPVDASVEPPVSGAPANDDGSEDVDDIMAWAMRG